jgi:hypothetical protein
MKVMGLPSLPRLVAAAPIIQQTLDNVKEIIYTLGMTCLPIRSLR